MWSVAYAVICAFLLKYFSGEAGATPVWIPAGIGLGVLLVYGYQYWPFIFIGAIVGEMAGGFDFGIAILLSAGSVSGFIVTFFILKKLLGFKAELNSLFEYISLLVVSGLAALVSTSVNIQFLIWSGLLAPGNFSPVFKSWFTGDYFGMAFITPILIILSKPWTILHDQTKGVKYLAIAVLAFLLGQGIFFGWFKDVLDLTGKGNIYLFFFGVSGLLFWTSWLHAAVCHVAGPGCVGCTLWGWIH